MNSSIAAAVLAVAGLLFNAAPAQAVLTSADGRLPEAAAADGAPLQARLYHLSSSRVFGQVSVRQGVTVWEITQGTWNGQSLQGLSLVLVNNPVDRSQARSTTRCYVSYGATSAQRAALLDAYFTSQSLPVDDGATLRIEPAVIRLERVGSMVVVRLGLVA